MEWNSSNIKAERYESLSHAHHLGATQNHAHGPTIPMVPQKGLRRDAFKDCSEAALRNTCSHLSLADAVVRTLERQNLYLFRCFTISTITKEQFDGTSFQEKSGYTQISLISLKE